MVESWNIDGTCLKMSWTYIRRVSKGLHGGFFKSRWLLVAFMEHYNDVKMSAIASQITSLTIIYSTVYSDTDQRKHQSSVSLAFVRGIHRWPLNSPHKGPVTRKMSPFDDVIMNFQFLDFEHSSSWACVTYTLGIILRCMFHFWCYFWNCYCHLDDIFKMAMWKNWSGKLVQANWVDNWDYIKSCNFR